jgi:CRISPR type I-E-associated protein CasB/Cse2
MSTEQHYFINQLEKLKGAENRAALAALRRGLGQPPGHAPEMHPYVVRFLPKDAFPNSWVEQSYYLVASLYGLHPEKGTGANLGHHFAQTLDPNPDYNQAIERRFTALLTAHPDDLAFYLRQAVSFLKSRQQPVAVNWHQLMKDVLDWGNPYKQPGVQKRWAGRFWGRPDNDPAATEEAGAAVSAPS